MEKQEMTTAEEAPAEPASVGRGSQIVVWMLLAGVIAVGVGALGLATAFTIERIISDDSGFGISDAVFLFGISASGSTFALSTHVTILALLVFLPARHMWKRPIPTTWVTVLSAVAGGVISSLPWLIRWLLAMTSGITTITSGSSKTDQWIAAAVYAAAGCFVGAIFGFSYAVLERRGGGLPGTKSAKISETVAPTPEAPIAKTSFMTSSFPAWISAGVLLAFVGLMIWFFTTPVRMVTSARRVAVKNQTAIVAEAQKMLDEAAMAESGDVDYGYSSGPSLPEVFAKTGAYSAATSQRLPGVVKLHVTSGFTHFGLFIVPEPTSATVPMLRDAVVHEDYGSLKVVNDHLYQYSEGS